MSKTYLSFNDLVQNENRPFFITLKKTYRYGFNTSLIYDF